MTTPPTVQTNALDPVPNASDLLSSQHGQVHETEIVHSIIAHIWMQWFTVLREKVNTINSFLATWAGIDPVSGVTPGTYGDATHFPVVTINKFGQTTGVTLRVVSGGGGSGTPPLVASFTTFGSGITIADKTARMQMFVTSIGGQLRGLTEASIATPYTIDMHAQYMGAPVGGDVTECGLCLSDGTKFMQFTAGSNNGIPASRIISWNSSTSASAVVISSALAIDPSDFYVRITDSGTTRTYLLSANGLDFFPFYSQATNTFLTPTQFGMCVYNDAVSSLTATASILNWVVTNSVLGNAP